MAKEKAEIILDGDVSPFRQKLREASADLKRFGSEGEGAVARMTGPLGALQSKFVAIGAILAGGAVFNEAVAQAATFTEESMKLGHALGVSASEASTFIAALADIDVSQEDFIGAAKGLSKELMNNEASLQAMGLKTRDAAGHLRPLNQLTVEGIEIVKSYKEGTDRALAGQVMFGKKFQLTGNLLKLNNETLAENAALQKSLGAIVSQENVAAWEAFDAAGDKSNLTLKAMQMTVGNALIPALTDLGNWFVAIGPAAVTVIRGVFGGLAATFHFVTTGVTVLWETLNAMIVTVAEPIRALGESISKALDGDWSGARAAIANIGTNIKDAWGKAMDEMEEKSRRTRERVSALFSEGTPAAPADAGGKSAAGLVKKEKEPKAAKDPDPSFMSTYEARLAEAKNVFEQENLLRQFGKEQELAYWRELQQGYELTSKDRVAIAKRTATLELEIRRQEAKEMRDLDSVMLDSRRAAALAQVELEAQQAGFARDNGEITKMELLSLEEQFARRRFEIEYQSLLERQEMLKNDPSTSPAALAQIKEQMLQVERTFQMQRGQIGQNKKEEGGGVFGNAFDNVGSSFGQMASSLLTSASTLRQQLGQVFLSIGQSFISNVVNNTFGKWLAERAKMIAMELGFLKTESAAKQETAVKGMAITGEQAMVEVGNKGASAAAGAADSVASIPYIGPVLAAAAFAATMAMVLGSRSNIKSASRGFDIPAGLNPLTQLHEEEMVLPAVHANTIRRLGEAGVSEQGGAAAGGGAINLHVRAVDGASVKRLFMDHGPALAAALRAQARNFTATKA